MIYDKRSALSGYVSGLLSVGRTTFTAEEAEQKLGVGHRAFLSAAERLQHRRALLSPRQGFYVVVPPQYASWGAPPPAWYIDALMSDEGEDYYVGLLKAAELHGATHQAVMEFQVISGKRFPKIRAGRSLIAFYFRKNMEAVTAGIEDRKTDTGSMKISSVPLTAFDLFRYPQASGGIDNVATVLADLGQKIDPEQLAILSVQIEKPVVQRLGYMLEYLGYSALTKPMSDKLQARGALPWAELDRQEARDPDFAPEPKEHDTRWRVIVRRMPEIDK